MTAGILHAILAGTGTRIPILIGFGSNGAGNPTIPGHQAGDLLVSLATANSAATPTAADAGGGGTWSVVSAPTPASSCGASLVSMTATGSSHTIEWTGATSVRAVWVFRTAAIDVHSVLIFASSTTLDWPNLAMTTNGIVCAYVMTRNSQTDIAAAIALGGNFIQRTAKNTIPAAWVGDTNTNLESSFNPANDTFDTSSSGHVVAAFSIKAA